MQVPWHASIMAHAPHLDMQSPWHAGTMAHALHRDMQAMLAADFLSHASNLLSTLHLSVSNPSPQSQPQQQQQQQQQRLSSLQAHRANWQQRQQLCLQQHQQPPPQNPSMPISALDAAQRHQRHQQAQQQNHPLLTQQRGPALQATRQSSSPQHVPRASVLPSAWAGQPLGHSFPCPSVCSNVTGATSTRGERPTDG